jgi:multidrug efflux pump
MVNFSAAFIHRPIATTLLTIGVALAGILAFRELPVSPLPQVDFPTISVQAALPGASPDTMASSVAAPLERHLGQIADVTEMTSMSSVGSTRITLQFGLDRDINGAARDVQAAINAARADLPTSLHSNPTYKKVNPADAPILILALTSKTRTPGQLYDSAATVLQQRLSQLPGIGEVDVNGSALPAVRVELNPDALFKYGIGLEDVRAALASANADSPKGAIEDGPFHYQIYTNDQASLASQYRDLVVAYRNGAGVRLSDVAEVDDSVEDLRNAGLVNGKPAVLVILYRQPGGNILDAVDNVRAELPQLRAALPGDVDVMPVADRSTTIRTSLADTERTLILSVGLVILVVFFFLRDARATLIPSVAVPVSIIGTFAAMYLFGYSLDNLSLMALTIATGFVVDDAIVVLENVSRHLEAGVPRLQAALLGAQEVGFTVVSMSVSLVAVFLPILLMGGIVGRLFREFAVTLSMAVLISLVVSLTTTPMLCSRFLRPHSHQHAKGIFRVSEWIFDAMLRFYGRTLRWALRHPLIIITILAVTVALNVELYIRIPKGFFPEQDTGRLIGGIQADQSISFQLMRQKFAQLQAIVQSDPAVDNIAGFTGGGRTNAGFSFISLKPLAERGVSAEVVMTRLRRKLSQVPGGRLFLQPVQDIRIGGRQSNALYQYTLQADDAATLYAWAPRIETALQHAPELTDVNSDQQQKGLETLLEIDRPTAARVGLTPSAIDNTLYDAFGQRQVSTIYNALNQYHVIMEVAPRYWQNPEMLKQVWVSTSGANASGTQTTNASVAIYRSSSSATSASSAAAAIASSSARNQAINSIAASGRSSASSGASVSTSEETMVPLAVFSQIKTANTPLGVNHQGQFVATTISFNLAEGRSLSDAQAAIGREMNELRVPASIHGSFAGAAATFQQWR